FLWQQTYGGETLLHMAVQGGKGKSFDKRKPLVTFLLGKDPDFLSTPDDHGETAVFKCVERGLENVARFLCEATTSSAAAAALAVPGNRKDTCLHIALRKD